jgi:hypothetical protein
MISRAMCAVYKAFCPCPYAQNSDLGERERERERDGSMISKLPCLSETLMVCRDQAHSAAVPRFY